MTRTGFTLLTLMVLAGCSAPGMPIPVRGDVSPLVGHWEGEYSSSETGRVGSIVFTLVAGQDTATGDILMIPANMETPGDVTRTPDPNRRTPQVLKVSFVRCEGMEVTGWLDPYTDPDTGERVYTTFEGTLKGDRLEGTFTSLAELSGRRTSGKWMVKRKTTG